jgi:hypothetical protein
VEMVGEDEASMSPWIGGEGAAGGVVVLVVVVVVVVVVEARTREASITCSRLPTASCRRRRMAARCGQSPRRQNRTRPWRTLGRARNVTGSGQVGLLPRSGFCPAIGRRQMTQTLRRQGRQLCPLALRFAGYLHAERFRLPHRLGRAGISTHIQQTHQTHQTPHHVFIPRRASSRVCCLLPSFTHPPSLITRSPVLRHVVSITTKDPGKGKRKRKRTPAENDIQRLTMPLTTPPSRPPCSLLPTRPVQLRGPKLILPWLRRVHLHRRLLHVRMLVVVQPAPSQPQLYYTTKKRKTHCSCDIPFVWLIMLMCCGFGLAHPLGCVSVALC